MTILPLPDKGSPTADGNLTTIAPRIGRTMRRRCSVMPSVAGSVANRPWPGEADPRGLVTELVGSARDSLKWLQDGKFRRPDKAETIPFLPDPSRLREQRANAMRAETRA